MLWALAVFAILMVIAFALVLSLNALTIGLSVVGLFLAASYPYLKRYTHLPQVYLGMAFGWGIPMAFAAIEGEVPAVAWVLYVANIFWTTGYDTWYAMVDREDDLRAGSKSTAILFGDLDLVAQGILYALTLLALALAPRIRVNAVAPGTIATDINKALVDKAIDIHFRELSKLLGGLTRGDRDELGTLLGKLLATFENERADGEAGD